MTNNSGTFILVRGLVRTKGIISNFSRTTGQDFAIGVGWGFQNYQNRLGWSFSVAPSFYFDGKGNSGVFPFIPELILGTSSGKKKKRQP